MPTTGEVIQGKYRLDRLVGTGGMGVVYAATHLALSQAVAIKFVRPDPTDKRTATLRLVREARAVARLTSEYVARVQDVGELDDGSAFLVMELLDGTTLQEIVRSRGKLPLADACDAAIQVCHALGDAHARGIVHRDIKPSNLFVVKESSGPQRVKVIDFGVSKANRGLDDGGMLETKTGSLLGSPPFMSPEQIRAASEVDARTDLWSLGIVLYFLVTGRLPFVASSLLDLMTLIAYEAPPPLEVPEVGAEFEAVILRCLQKKREDRFPSAAALAAALKPFASDHGRFVAASVASEGPSVVVEPTSTDAPLSRRAPAHAEGDRTLSKGEAREAATVDGVSSEDTPPEARPRSRRRAVAVGFLAVFAIVSTAAIGVTRVKRPSPAAATAPAPAPAPPPSSVPAATLEAPVPSAPPSAPPPSPRASEARPAAPASTAPRSKPRATPHPRTPPPRSPTPSANATPALPTTPD